MNRNIKHTRSLNTQLQTRNNEDNLTIEGYFAVFNSETELWTNAFEEIDKTAFNSSLKRDIRALINHDTTLVLARTKSKTLELTVDEKGLYGKVKINKNDSEAMNLYERVKRGDVDQCSFGFEVTDEEVEYREDESVKWTIKDLNLYEVSVCTFPAYEATGVQARHSEVKQHREKQILHWKENMKGRLENGVKTNNVK